MYKKLVITALVFLILYVFNSRVSKDKYTNLLNESHELKSLLSTYRDSLLNLNSVNELNKHLMLKIDNGIDWNSGSYIDYYPNDILDDYYAFELKNKIKYRNPVFRRINPKYFEVAIEENHAFLMDSEIFWEFKILVIVIEDDGSYKIFEKVDF